MPSQRTLWIVSALLLAALGSYAQLSESQPAQVGISSPLPVFVTNTPPLPQGFTPGSTWRFTTWTMPSVLTWTARVNRTSGPWAQLSVKTEDGGSSTRWYYVPGMPGSWEPQ